MTGFAAEQTQVIVHATLSFFLSEPTIFPELHARVEASLGVLDVVGAGVFWGVPD